MSRNILEMKKVIISLLVLSTAIVAQSKLTLSEAITLGLENNYNLRISQKSVEISDENNSWGAAGRYPTIDLSVTSINRFDHTENTNTDVTINNIAPSATLNWVLFNGFRIFNSKSKLEDQYNLSLGYDAITVENTIQSIILSYYDVLLQRERLNVFSELESLSKDRFKRTETSQDIGGSVTYDVLQAKTAWLEDRSNHLSQKLNFDNSIRRLNLLMGEKSDKVYNEFEEFLTDTSTYALDDLKTKMLSRNKTLKNQYLNEVISERDIDIARGGIYPKINLSAGYDYLNSRQKVNSLPSSKSNSYDYYGNLSLSLNLFDGLNTKRSLEIAKIQKEISMIETEEMVHTLTNSLLQLLELYDIQKDLLIVAEENLAAAKLNFEISAEKFRNGAINSFNYRDVQIVYLNASLQKLNSIYNLISTDTELARITGSIISED
jgi:outer membrane protein TolC